MPSHSERVVTAATEPIGDRPDTLTKHDEVPIKMRDGTNEIPRWSLSGKTPIVQLDDHHRKAREPFGVLRKELALRAFDIDFADKRLTIGIARNDFDNRLQRTLR